jgi:Protein of unknown function (DUF3617)
MYSATKTAAILCALLLFPTAVLAAGSPMQEGLWEITTTMSMPGMPYKMPPTKVTHCYTKEDLKDSQRTIPKQQGDCKVTDMKSSGNRVTWKMVCTGNSAGKGEGEILYKGTSAYEGSMKMETQGMVMTSKYKARRIGACK